MQKQAKTAESNKSRKKRMIAKTVNIHEAKTHLSRLLRDVILGEEVVIAKAGKPIARLVPIANKSFTREPGSATGKVTIAPDFNAPLPESVFRTFEE